MTGMQKAITVATIGASLLTGGAIGASLAGPLAASAATSSTASTAATNNAAAGKFVPNENAAHEAGESAAREAMENAGQFPTIP